MRNIRDRWVPNFNGFFFIFLVAIGLIVGAAFLPAAHIETILSFGIFGLVIFGFFVISGFRVLQPNESAVLIFVGKYVGTIKRSGFIWSLPFTSTDIVSLRYVTLNTEPLKVNDSLGNPIEIGAVVVWRVQDSAKAALNVEHYDTFVSVQAETAIRTLAARFPYDDIEEDVPSLRGSPEIISKALEDELQDRLAIAGIEIVEARLSHLAYAPEIAAAMLKRQQAQAVVSARRVITENAVAMVEGAVHDLEDRSVLQLSNDQKAALVSNLMVALVSDSDAQPVVNIGSS